MYVYSEHIFQNVKIHAQHIGKKDAAFLIVLFYLVAKVNYIFSDLISCLLFRDFIGFAIKLRG